MSSIVTASAPVLFQSLFPARAEDVRRRRRREQAARHAAQPGGC